MLRTLTLCLLLVSPLVLSAPHGALDRTQTDSNRFVAAGLPALQPQLSSRPLMQLAQRKSSELRNGKRSKRISSQSGLTLNQAIAIAKARVPGELVSASRKAGGNGQVVYHVKILTRKGVVRTVRVPANSGQ
ncbi:MAG: PepSY domain-containing protein [Gammaproteobacteria bacterium]|nr:PepSY domain-containing protein [Gammaproteobacteria bacterium]NND38136.1 PepSY domain-containing protein [Pseudomonadales bacterium]NNL12026.1 PepSY domain-containing protein [Pseudomonadales bacterium]